MRKIVQSFFMLMLLTTMAWAQEKTVTGIVTAKDDGLPIPGASVKVKGTTQGTQTDANGKFSLKVTGENAVLVISFIGSATQEVKVSATNTVSVVLLDDKTQLGEVVVTALGISRQKKDLGYAATTIKAAELTKVNAVNVVNGLQGKVSGLNITTINSGVNEEVVITLRGLRSLTGNNDPLLVLDGVPTPLSYLSSLNPNDVENVSVLKGSSSAAIYGPDARNGVINITTKRGTADKPVITISNSTQFQSISFFPKFQTQFGSGGYGNYIPYENWSWGPAFDGSNVEVGKKLPDGSIQTVKYSPNDERKNFFDTGVTMQNDISIASKDFYLSIQDAIVKGIVPGDQNRRTGVRLNSSKEYGKLKAGLNVNYIQNNFKIFNDDGDNGMGDYFSQQNIGNNEGLMNQIFNTPANIPISKYKDFKNDKFSQYNNYYNDYGLNPYFAIDNWRNEGKRQDLLANLDLNFKATDWLSITYRPSLSSRTISERFISKGEIPDKFGLGRSFTSIPSSVQERAYTLTRLASEAFASLNLAINNDFKVSGILGTYVRQTQSRDTKVGASSLVAPDIFNIGNRVGNLSGTSPERKDRLFSVYGSASLSYKGWANVEVTGRNDQTSLLAAGNNSYFYPGVSGAFIVTDALELLKNNPILSYLKFRGSWNKTGNADIAPYQLASIFTQPDYTGFPYGSLPSFSASNTTFNAKLKPEFIESTEFGVETGFLDGRITLEASYFNQNNTNQIVSVRTSDATGYNFANLNAASFVNKGYELDLGLTPLIKWKDGNFQFKANATYNDSKVNSIYPGLNELTIGGYVASGNSAIVGKPAFEMMATDYLRDDKGRVIVDAISGYPSQDPNRKQYGRVLPLWIVGLNPSASWKGFNLSVLAEYKGGHVASFYTYGGGMAWTGVSAATEANNRERFVMPNSVYEDPANPGSFIENTNVTISNVNDFFTGVYRDVASNFITSAAAWRIREVSLSYDVPSKYLSKQKIVKGITLGVTGRNIFVWVPKTNQFTDPDFNSVREDYQNSFGIVNGQSNPPVRMIGFNLVGKF